MSPRDPAAPAPLFAQPRSFSDHRSGPEIDVAAHAYHFRSPFPPQACEEGGGNEDGHVGMEGLVNVYQGQYQQTESASSDNRPGNNMTGQRSGVNQHSGNLHGPDVTPDIISHPNPIPAGQTWIEYLRASESAPNTASEADINPFVQPFNLHPRPRSNQYGTDNPLPPLPSEISGPQHLNQHQLFQRQSLQQNRHHPQLHPSSRPTRSDSHSASTSNSRFALPALPSSRGERPHSERTSSDRKRRLTTAEGPVRRPSGARTTNLAAPSLGTSSDPIVLDSSPASATPTSAAAPPYSADMRISLPAVFRPRSQGGRNGAGNPVVEMRRPADFELPAWQSDAEVSYCFVCRSQFTFFYRKHHCRKCGRVVCAACSPHRITIPLQFIVHPPVGDLTANDEDNAMVNFGPFRNPALGGGEVVRVCNPCVPDPNYDPPQSIPSPYHSPISSPTQSHPPRQASLGYSALSRGHRSTRSVTDSSQTIRSPQTNLPADHYNDRRALYSGSISVTNNQPSDLHSPPTPLAQQQARDDVLAFPSPGYEQHARAHSRPNPPSPSNTLSPPSYNSNRNSTDTNMFRRSFFSRNANAEVSLLRSHLQIQQSQQTPPQRRQITEEDECPICGNELPPKRPEDEDAARVEHVKNCLALHSSSPPPPLTSGTPTSTSLPAQRTRGMSNAAGLAAGGGNSRVAMAARGMVVYTATEKDCVDDDGAEAECVICFEEFESGVKMARLVCFCKFHEGCIKKWWETKGRGACPTHQLHE